MTDPINERSQILGWLEQRLGRRGLLKAGALTGAGITAAALLGCGDDDEDESAQAPAGGGQQPAGGGQAAKPQHPDGDFVQRAKDDGSPFPYNYPEKEGSPKPGGTMRIGVGWDVGVWDTNKTVGAHSVSTGNFVANRLIRRKNGPLMSKYKIELEPELAKSWEISPDGLTVTFRLNTGVKFQNVAPLNARPFVARDVKLAYERAAAAPLNALYFALMDSITAPDDNTVVVKMKRPDADFLIPLSDKALPIYPQELYDQALIDTKIVGTGPFILDATEKSQFIRMRQNPDYFEGKPLLDGVEYRVIPDVQARTAAYRAGQIDWGADTATKPNWEAVQRSNPDSQIMADPILLGIFAIGTRPDNPKFKDDRVRQAFMSAIDRPKIVQVLNLGFGRALPSFPWPMLFDKAPTDSDYGPWWKHDPANAKKLLEAAGATGLTFDYVDSKAYGDRSSLNALLIDMLREAGITMQYKDTPAQDFNSHYYARGWLKSQFDSIVNFSTAAPSINGYWWDNNNSKSAKNYLGINDAQIDEWTDKIRSEVNVATRKDLMKRVWDRMLGVPLRIDGTSAVLFSLNFLQPYLRHYRWNGPFIGVHSFYDWGWSSHKAWIDK